MFLHQGRRRSRLRRLDLRSELPALSGWKLEFHPVAGAYVNLRLSSGTRIPLDFTLRGPIGEDHPALARDGRHETGDRSFDRRFEVVSFDGTAAALLDADLRRRFQAAAEHGDINVGVHALWWTLSLPGIDRASVAPRVEEALAIAQALELDRAEIPARLAAQAASDPEPAVRLACLEALVRHHPEAAPTRPALRRALGGEDPALRLFAAEELGGEGEETLSRLAVALELPWSIRARALRSLAARPGERRAAALLDFVRIHEPSASQRDEARALLLAELKPGDLPALAPWLVALAGESRFAVAVVEAVERAPGPAADRVLEALIPALVALGEAPEAAAALRAINSRLGPGRGGRLTLDGEPARGSGELSVAAEGGGVSLAAGQASDNLAQPDLSPWKSRPEGG